MISFNALVPVAGDDCTLQLGRLSWSILSLVAIQGPVVGFVQLPIGPEFTLKDPSSMATGT